MLSTKVREKSTGKMKQMRLLVVLLIPVVALILGGAVSTVWAKRGFEDADVYAELNDTDEDLGFHALIDGEAWKYLKIEDPNGREMLNLLLRGRLRRQGLTELFFESAEPPFDELSPEEFFDRFPEGEYEIKGVTLKRKWLISRDFFWHVMPAPPEGITINGVELGDHKEVECPDGGPSVSLVNDTVTIAWEQVEESHPEVGEPGEEIEVALYQVVVEQEDEDLTFSADLPPEITELALPPGLLEPGNVKFEILVKEEEGGNQTAVESCFTIE